MQKLPNNKHVSFYSLVVVYPWQFRLCMKIKF